MKKGLLRSTAMTVAAVAGFSSMAHADSVLATMEAMIMGSGAPDGAFVYDSVVSDTETGFEITGVRMEPEPGELVTIDRLRLDAIDITAVEAGGPPSFMDLTAEGVFVPADSLDADAREVFPDGMTFDIVVDYALDTASQGLVVNEFTFSVPEQGEISVSADLTGLSMDSLAGAVLMGPESLAEAALSSATITLDDEGGLGALLEAIAADEGMDVDSFVSMALLPQMEMMGGMFATDPAGTGLIASIIGFVGDYADPRGPLTITAQPDSPVTLSSLLEMADPSALPSALGLSSSYEGGAGSGQDTDADAPAQTGQGADTDASDEVTEGPTDQTGPDGAFATLLAMARGAGMPEDALSYDQVISDGPDNFILSNVRFEPEPGDYMDIEMLSVSKIDMDSIMNGAPPMILQLAAQGVDMPTSGMDNDIQQLLGTDTLKANFYLDYALDQASGAFDLNGLTMEIPDFGSLTFTLAMSEVDPSAVMAMAMTGPDAMSDALLESAALSFTDDGIMQSAIAFIAEEEGMSEDEVLSEMFAEMEQLQPMFADDPIASAALDAMGEFLEDYQAPRGPISVVLNPPTPISMTEIGATADPSQLPEKLGLVVGY